jgi:hypothetical protein
MEAVAKSNLSPEVVESLVLNGDMSRLNPGQKVEYYRAFCGRLGLDPMTQPFKILRLNGKEILYADKGATQQLSQMHNISHEVTRKEQVGDVYVVTVRAKIGDRFTDEDGAVTINGLKGDALANALMKAVTKAKRRAVLALMGLGMMDETEIETVKGAEHVPAPLAPSTADALTEAEPEKPNYEDHPEATPVVFGRKSVAYANKGKVLRIEDLTNDELHKAIQYASEKPELSDFFKLATMAWTARKANETWQLPNKEETK